MVAVLVGMMGCVGADWFSEKDRCLLIARSEGSLSEALISDLVAVVVVVADMAVVVVVVVVAGGVGVCAWWSLVLFWLLRCSDL